MATAREPLIYQHILVVSKLCKSTQPTNWHALVCLFIISFALRHRRGKIRQGRQGEASSTQRKHCGSEMYQNHWFKSLSKCLRDIMLN